MKMITSKVIQVTWLTDQLNNPNNLHVCQNLSILIVVLVELEEETKLTNYWPVYGLVDDVTKRHTVVILLFELSQSISVPLLSKYIPEMLVFL